MGFTSPFLSEYAIKAAESHSRWANLQRRLWDPTNCLGEVKNNWTAGRGWNQLSRLEGSLFNLLSCAECIRLSGFAVVTLAGMCSGETVLFKSFLLMYVSPVNSANNLSKIQLSTLDMSSICSHLYLGWVDVCIVSPQEKFCQKT